MENVLRDLRSALRALLGSPGFTVTAVLSLALGLGATTAIFSVVDGMLLSRPPYADPDQLMTLWSGYPGRGVPRMPSSFKDYQDLREQAPSFDALAAHVPAEVNLSGDDTPERVRAIQVAGDLARVLRIKLPLGRVFLPEEQVYGRHNVVILSHGLWKRRFAQDPAIVGKTVLINSQSFTVVGVLPRELEYPSTNIQLWLPLAPEPGSRYESRRTRFVEMIGRLKPGVTEERARKELKTIGERLAQQYEEDKGLALSLMSLREQRTGDFRTGLLVTLGAVFFVLLIACANVANLMLARGVRRQRELAIRAALGATRGRLIQQLLTESVLLAVMGGLVGLVIAYLGVNSARTLVPAEVAHFDTVTLNGEVLVFSLALSVATGLLFGVVPAMSSSRVDLIDALKESAPTSGGRGGVRLRGVLVAAEVALAVVLLVGGGLMLHSLQKTLAVNPGFTPDGVLTVNVSLPEAKYKSTAQASAFFRQLLERVSHLPGVERAGAVSSLPMGGFSINVNVTVDGRAENAGLRLEDLPTAEMRVVQGSYFDTMRIGLRRGRFFGPEDGSGTMPVAIVNETSIARLFSGEDPIGKQIIMGPPDHLLSAATLASLPGGRQKRFTVIGVIRDVRTRGLRNPVEPEVYLLQDQSGRPPLNMVLTARASSGAATLMPMLRKAVTELDPDQALAEAKRMEEFIDASLLQPRMLATFLAAFGLVALAMAMIGVSGVVAYSVNQRMREFGVRLALGATGGHIFGQVFKQGGSWVGLGVLLGLGGALLVTRVMAGLLFNLSPVDPMTYLAVLIGLGGATLVALYLPARRAMRVDPQICLRME